MDQYRRIWLSRAVFGLLGAALLVVSASSVDYCQSTDQSFPTAITGNELTGSIKARDIGDPRVTSYYFTFNAGQGDLFINIVTKNLNGAVNLFAADGLRPLGQVLVYADLSASETGRVIYFRKPEKVILRVEGRTPNDDRAEFQIKFAGSFEAAMPTEEVEAPTVSKAALETDSGVKVNSVGTIIAVVPKPTPAALPVKKEPEKRVEKTGEETVANAAETKPAETAGLEKSDAQTAEKPAATEPKPEEAAKKPVTEENTAADKKTENAKTASTSRRPARRARNAVPEPKKTQETETAKIDADKVNPETTSSETKPEPKETAKTQPKKTIPTRNKRVVVTENVSPAKPDPMANISLVILFKDGTRVDRPMNEVTRFSVDRGVLTVVNKDGTTAKYSILDVTSVTIQNP